MTASVLIVEDEWIVGRAVRQTLEAASYEVTDVVSSVADARAAVARRKPDLALVDIGLVDGDGIDLAEQLGNIPVVFVTARSDAATVARATKTTPAGYVVKPFQDRQLLGAVALALAKAGVRTSPRPAET